MLQSGFWTRFLNSCTKKSMALNKTRQFQTQGRISPRACGIRSRLRSSTWLTKEAHLYSLMKILPFCSRLPLAPWCTWNWTSGCLNCICFQASANGNCLYLQADSEDATRGGAAYRYVAPNVWLHDCHCRSKFIWTKFKRQRYLRNLTSSKVALRDMEQRSVPKTGRMSLHTSTKGFMSISPSLVLTCFIPSNEGVSTDPPSIPPP